MCACMCFFLLDWTGDLLSVTLSSVNEDGADEEIRLTIPGFEEAGPCHVAANLRPEVCTPVSQSQLQIVIVHPH